MDYKPGVTAIYGLIDPRTGALRYVGKADDPVKRLRRHVWECRQMSCYRHRWVAAVVASGNLPRLVVLQVVANADWSASEKAWISYYRARGLRLVNDTDGGDGGLGRAHTPDELERMSAVHKAYWADPEAKAEQSERTRIRWQSADVEARRQRTSIAMKERWATPEYRAKMLAAHQGRGMMTGHKHSPESRARMSESHKANCTPERRAAISERLKGRPVSPETRAKLSAIRRDNPLSPEAQARITAAHKGKVVSPEVRTKISAARRRQSAAQLSLERSVL